MSLTAPLQDIALLKSITKRDFIMIKKSSKTTLEVIEDYKNSDTEMKALADDMGLKYSTLQRKLNPHDDYQLSVTDIVPLIKLTGNLSLITHLNTRLNMMAIKMPKGHDNLDMETFTTFTTETGEALAALGNSLADNTITKEERDLCRKELTEMLQVGFSILKALENS